MNQPKYPQAGVEEIKRLYSIIADEYTNRYADDLSDAPIIDELIAELPPGGKILDVGCGPGTFSGYLSQHGLIVQGIDVSPAMLAWASRRLPTIEFHEMDMRAMRFADNMFDGVLAAYSLIHIPDAELDAVLTEIRRVLRHDGLLLAIVQIGEPDHVEADPLAPGEHVFVNFFDPERLQTALVRSGFSVKRLETLPTQGSASMSAGIIWLLARPLSAL